MPPAQKQTIAAPPSPGWSIAQRLSRIKALRAKSTSSRSAAETKELVDTLVSMLPPGTLQ